MSTVSNLVASQEPTSVLLWTLIGLFIMGLAIRLFPWWLKSSLSIGCLVAGMGGLFIAARGMVPHISPSSQSMLWLLVAICGYGAAHQATKVLNNPHLAKQKNETAAKPE